MPSLRARRWEKKSSRFRLKAPGAQGEKSWLPTKKTPTFALAYSRSRRTVFLGLEDVALPMDKLCPLLGVRIVARSCRYKAGRLRTRPPGLCRTCLMETARTPPLPVREFNLALLTPPSLNRRRRQNPLAFGHQSCRPRPRAPSFRD